MKKARQNWKGISSILKREGTNAVTMASFYMAVVQSALLYGTDLWTIYNRNWKGLESFHRRACSHMTWQHIQKHEDGS